MLVAASVQRRVLQKREYSKYSIYWLLGQKVVCVALQRIKQSSYHCKDSLAVVAEKVIPAAQKIDSSRAEPVHACKNSLYDVKEEGILL